MRLFVLDENGAIVFEFSETSAQGRELSEDERLITFMCKALENVTEELVEV